MCKMGRLLSVIEGTMASVSQFNADLELQHIYLEVYAERYHHLKAFIEAYYCFTHGAVTKNDKPDWEAIFDTGLRTTQSCGVMDRKLLVRDMLVPFSVLVGMMKVMVRDDDLTIDGLRQLLDEKLQYVILKRVEYSRLVKQGLKEAMPAGFYQTHSHYYQQNTARYDVADITLVE